MSASDKGGYPTEPGGEIDIFFGNLATGYQWQTRVLTCFSDQRWRRFTAAAMRLAPGDQVLDLATGTGQLARAVARNPARPRVSALDLNRSMLRIAALKSRNYTNIEYLQADARCLPFADNTFSAISMGFGLRIIPERQKLLKECWRVLKGQGRVYFLETAAMDGWRRRVLQALQPYLPGLLARLNRRLQAYRYLLDSMLDFPSSHEIQKTLHQAGFVAARSFLMKPSLACVHIAEKP